MLVGSGFPKKPRVCLWAGGFLRLECRKEASAAVDLQQRLVACISKRSIEVAEDYPLCPRHPRSNS